MKMNLERWVDELAGEIDNIKKMIAVGLGNKVEYTPQQWVDATKLGTLSINGTDTDIEMPEIDMTAEYESGTKIATFSYNGADLDINIPTPETPAAAKPFIDVSNVIAQNSGSYLNSQINWTATDDCYFCATLVSGGGASAPLLSITVNDVTVWQSQQTTTYGNANTCMLPIKKGQTVKSLNHQTTDTRGWWKAFGLLAPTAPTPAANNTRKLAKKKGE